MAAVLAARQDSLRCRYHTTHTAANAILLKRCSEPGTGCHGRLERAKCCRVSAVHTVATQREGAGSIPGLAKYSRGCLRAGTGVHATPGLWDFPVGALEEYFPPLLHFLELYYKNTEDPLNCHGQHTGDAAESKE